MNRILDYDALFNERGEQANICTDADVGGNYASERRPERQTADRTPQIPAYERAPRIFEPRRVEQKIAERECRYPIRRRPARFVEFDTFEKPDRTRAEVRECFEKTALLFASIITMIVAIAILL